MNERVIEAIESDPIAKAIITTREAMLIMPAGLMPTFIQIVCEYAEQHGELPDNCVRGVEIAVLQRGIRAMREELEANEALGVKMGWREKEEEEA